MPPAMRTPGSRPMTIGLVVMLLSVSAGMHSDGFGVLLCLSFMGVLVGANLLAVAVRMEEEPAPIVPVVSSAARALSAFVRRNTAAVGLVMAFFAITALFSEEDPALCLGMFTLLLSGLTLINISARGE